MNTNELTQKLNEISEMLEPGKKLIPEDVIVKFQYESQGLDKKLEKIVQEGRELRLGIVGQVKAGKSSFLNALLFDGQDILPKAPTPMTAALTRISYSETPKAKIVFYNENDWDAIEKFASKYDEILDKLFNEYKENIAKAKEKESKKLFGNNAVITQEGMSQENFEKANRDKIPSEYRACKEVSVMARARSLNVRQYLGTEQIIEATQQDEYRYLKELNNYVGAEGKYTPIVKYTVISLCNELLKGIEVIDTPGMNDPILSRSRTTKEFLIQCDAVFLLGYCGQFLGAEDMNFIMSSLPDEGISKAVLIGSKMDSAILQYPQRNNPSFKTAYLGTQKNCKDQAMDNIRDCSRSAHNSELLSQVEKSLPPYCISSLAYSAARQMQKGEALGQYEQKMVDNLCKRFLDFKNDVNTLLGLSSIPDVRKEVFEETKKQKEQIIQKRINDVAFSQIVKFKNILEDINIQAKGMQNDLRLRDCDQLRKQLIDFKEKLDSVRIVVKNLFDEAAVDAKWAINEIAVITSEKMEGHLDITANREEKTEHHSESHEILFGLLGGRTDHWDEKIVIHTAEVNDVYNNIRKYRSSCMKTINDSFKSLLKIDELKDNILRVVKEAFEQAEKKDFDENRILGPLNNALKEISLPDFEIELQIYEEELDKELGGIVTNGIVKNDNIPLLHRAQGKVLNKMSRDIESKIKKQGEEISSKLQNEAAEFIDKIVNQLEERQKNLEKLIEKKEANLKKFDEFIEIISKAKQTLQSLEA